MPTFDELSEDPEKYGFKPISCDVCGKTSYYSEDWTGGCFNCMKPDSSALLPLPPVLSKVVRDGEWVLNNVLHGISEFYETYKYMPRKIKVCAETMEFVKTTPYCFYNDKNTQFFLGFPIEEDPLCPSIVDHNNEDQYIFGYFGLTDNDCISWTMFREYPE